MMQQSTAFPKSMTMEKDLKDLLTSKDWVSEYKNNHIDIDLKSDSIFSTADLSLLRGLGTSSPTGTADVPALTDAEESYSYAFPAVKKNEEENQTTDWMGEYNSLFGGASMNVTSLPLKPPAPTKPARQLSRASSVGLSVDMSTFMTPSMDAAMTSEDFTKKLTSDIDRLMEENIKAAQEKKKAANKKKKTGRNRDPEIKEYVEPTALDVLLGRGGRSNHHIGNKRYREEVLEMQKYYKSSSKNDKTEQSQRLVDRVHAYGGQFLKNEKGTDLWYIVTNLVARRKCSQALREHIPPEERVARRAAINALKAKHQKG